MNSVYLHQYDPVVVSIAMLEHRDTAVIASIADKLKLELEAATLRFVDVLRFLRLAATKPNCRLAPPPRVQTGWDVFRASASYSAFCYQYTSHELACTKYTYAEREAGQADRDLRRTMALLQTRHQRLSANWQTTYMDAIAFCGVRVRGFTDYGPSQ